MNYFYPGYQIDQSLQWFVCDAQSWDLQRVLNEIETQGYEVKNLIHKPEKTVSDINVQESWIIVSRKK